MGRELSRRGGTDMQTRIIIEGPYGREIIEQRPDAMALVSSAERFVATPETHTKMALEAMGRHGTVGKVYTRTFIQLEEW